MRSICGEAVESALRAFKPLPLGPVGSDWFVFPLWFLRRKQAKRDPSEEVVPVLSKTRSVAVCLWGERDPTLTQLHGVLCKYDFDGPHNQTHFAC